MMRFGIQIHPAALDVTGLMYRVFINYCVFFEDKF